MKIRGLKGLIRKTLIHNVLDLHVWHKHNMGVLSKQTGQIPLASTYSYHEALIYKYADYKSLTSLLVLFLLQAHLGATKVQHLNMLTPKSRQIEPGVPIKLFQLHNQNSDRMNMHRPSHASSVETVPTISLSPS
jgi:hypothetical protein